jgi:hypothetical protein
VEHSFPHVEEVVEEATLGLVPLQGVLVVLSLVLLLLL